jgi:hypothetical protein
MDQHLDRQSLVQRLFMKILRSAATVPVIRARDSGASSDHSDHR